MSSPARILVVEDDLAVRETIVEVLADEGYDVSSAANGAEALQRLAGELRPDLIVLDLMMPVMDGPTFRARQRTDPRLSGIPVLVLSASHRNEFAGGPLGEAFLAKPFDLKRFVDTVHRFC
ncbi:MAG: response regulator [Anaeromyxobacter sp.]